MKVLAGGMSLIPLMKLRLATPGQLVDIGRIPDLNYIREDKGALRIGAMASLSELEQLAEQYHDHDDYKQEADTAAANPDDTAKNRG